MVISRRQQSVTAELTPRCFVRPSYRLLRPRYRENLYPAGTSHFPRPWAGHVRRGWPPSGYTSSLSFSSFEVLMEAMMLFMAFFVTIWVSVLKPAEPCR